MKNQTIRGYVSNKNDDSKNIAVVQVSFLGRVIDAEYITPYGLYSSCPLKSSALIFKVGCDEGNLAAICNDPKNRVKELQEGEVVLSNLLTQTQVKLDKDGNVVISNATNVTINSSADINLNAEGNVSIIAGGDVNVNASGDATITASTVTTNGETKLDGGGQAVARQGDSVEVIISGIPYPGTITSGSSSVSSA